MLPSVKKMPPDEITSLHYITTGVYTTPSAVSHFMIFEVDAPLTETERIEEVMDKMIKK